jgi:hypothetical protein
VATADPTRIAEHGAAFPATGAGARALFCTLARLTYRQLCGLVQWPSETGAVIAYIGRCRSGNKANPGALYDPELFRREILPKLAGVKLTGIGGRVGLKGVRVGYPAWKVDAACSST